MDLISFDTKEYDVAESATVLSVSRVGDGSGVASASIFDAEKKNKSGILETVTWADGETGTKRIAIETNCLVLGLNYFKNAKAGEISLAVLRRKEKGVIAMTWKREWVPGEIYAYGEIVTRDNEFFICDVEGGTTEPPGTNKWRIFPQSIAFSLPHRWDGTRLEVQNPDGSWGEGVELKGAPGMMGINWKSEWSGEKSYLPRDVVSHSASHASYIAVSASGGSFPVQEPPGSCWEIFTKGIKGDVGPLGPQGVKGDRGIQWRGNWKAGNLYAMGDVVNLGANCYFAIAANANAMPPSDKWDLLAAGGGILKLPGIPFPAGEISSHETKTISVMLRGAEIGQVITASCRSPLPPGLTSQAFISSHEIVSLSLTNWLPHPVTLESALIWDFSVT